MTEASLRAVAPLPLGCQPFPVGRQPGPGCQALLTARVDTRVDRVPLGSDSKRHMAQGSLPGAPWRLPGACLALACDSPGGRPPSAMCPVTLSESWARPPQGRAAAPLADHVILQPGDGPSPGFCFCFFRPLAPRPSPLGPRPCSCPFAAPRGGKGGRPSALQEGRLFAPPPPRAAGPPAGAPRPSACCGSHAHCRRKL